MIDYDPAGEHRQRWDGPWMVRPDCLSHTHNTRASIYSTKRSKNPCICPHTRIIHESYKAEVRELRKKYDGRLLDEQRQERQIQARLPRSSNQRMPDLSAGSCNTKRGRYIMGAVADVPCANVYVEAKELCGKCPVLDTCRQWVLTAEFPTGGWGGIYAGMLPVERRAAIRNAA